MRKKQILVPFFTAALLLFSACEEKLVDHVNLVPQAVSVDIQNGSLPLNSLKSIQVPDDWKATATHFAEKLSKTAHLTLSVGTNNAPITILKNTNLDKEAYKLEITTSGVTIEANSIQGLNHALSTLHQLILTATNEKLPVLTINDKPRFGYRGLMLDCSRHFWTIDNLKETIDQMAFFKLNTLHMHLTDNNAWRLAMDKYPQLTEKGTY